MVSGMTGSTRLMHGNQQCIVIAIRFHRNNLLHVTGGLPFSPEPLSGPAVKTGATCLQGFPQAFLIHIGQHQNLPCPLLLNDGGNQFRFLKKTIQIHR